MGAKELLSNGHKVSFSGDKNVVFKLDCKSVYTTQ